MKLYTKTGDAGTSSLYTGERRSKSDAVFQALGDVDELNSAIGLSRTAATQAPQVQIELESIQSRLLDVGSAIATPLDRASTTKLNRAAFGPQHSEDLEHWIDTLDAKLPSLNNFILPSGGQAASFLHMARAICRRAERSVVPLIEAGGVDAAIGIYLNRLSDYLFVAARIMAAADGKAEVVYKKA